MTNKNETFSFDQLLRAASVYCPKANVFLPFPASLKKKNKYDLISKTVVFYFSNRRYAVKAYAPGDDDIEPNSHYWAIVNEKRKLAYNFKTKEWDNAIDPNCFEGVIDPDYNRDLFTCLNTLYKLLKKKKI